MQFNMKDESFAIAENGYTIEKVESFTWPDYKYKIRETNTFFTSRHNTPLSAYKNYFHTTPAIKLDGKVIIRCIEPPTGHFGSIAKETHKYFILETATYFVSDTNHIVDSYRQFCQKPMEIE